VPDGVHSLPFTRLLVSAPLWRAIRSHRPFAVVYLAKSSATLAAVIRARLLKWLSPGAPVVMVALQPRRLSAGARALARALRPDLLLVLSEAERQQAARWGVRTGIVSCGIDITRFRPPIPGERTALRQRWGIPDADTVLLHVGHLQSGRNLLALEPLASRPATTVIVVGSSRTGPGSDALVQRLSAHGIRVLAGFQPAIEELYRLADCYLFPVRSSDEAIALPLSVLEALASGVPVVCTPFGALPERLKAAHGIEFASSNGAFAAAVERLVATRPPTRGVAEKFSWNAAADQLLAHLEPLLSPPSSRRRLDSLFRLTLATIRRQSWRLEDVARVRIWGQPTGFTRRLPPTERVCIVERASGSASTDRVSASNAIGILGGAQRTGMSSPLAASAQFYGLSMVAGAGRELIGRARQERWPLLGLSLGAHSPVQAEALQPMRDFLREGGTLLVDGLGPAANGALEELGGHLGIELPPCAELGQACSGVQFAADRDFAREFAGVRVDTDAYRSYFATEQAMVRTWIVAGTQRYPAALEIGMGAGRLLLSAGNPRVQTALGGRDYGPHQALTLLPPMMAIQQLYGDRAWQAPAKFANFTIDDPVLRRDFLGLNFPRALALAKEHDFHLTIATVPRDLKLAQPDVVGLLQANAQRLSACYHGYSHHGYEFFLLPEGPPVRYRSRPLAIQERALEKAAEAGRRFAGRTGYALDRIMVFPQGLGPAAVLPKLQELGFLASCNALDREPLGASPNPDPDVGMRPADLWWRGFPLMWRRSLRDQTFPFDLFVGRPVIAFAHRKDVGRDLLPFAERAGMLGRLAVGSLRWRGLEEIARHAYLQRVGTGQDWQVQMRADEICLHNPDGTPRSYRVQRPHLPPGALLQVAGDLEDQPQAAEELTVTIKPSGTAMVQLTTTGHGLARRAPQCSVFRAP
jgi:glycosyltransferase involved in cell wall biosynthesis/peptidoglycan/xylan/chitin deacetylase (PgdA/CDA1 family)